jgi:hypothetical protein
MKKWAHFSKEGVQMASKCTKKCSTSLAMEKAACRRLKKLKIELAYDPVIPLLGIYPKERKSRYNRCLLQHYSQDMETTQMPYN